MEAIFKSMLLQPPFNAVQRQLADAAAARGRSARRCAISYAWPILEEERDLQARVLRLAEDLAKTGVPVALDLTSADQATSLAHAALERIRGSDIVLLVGSASYAERAKDPSTLTFQEAQALAEKKAGHSDAVIPLLMAGSFVNAFPPGYTGTLGASLWDQLQYFQNFPDITAKLLDVHQDPEVLAVLKAYRKETEQILQENQEGMHQDQAKEQAELQRKFWAARVQVLRSKFTHDQLKLVDGQITARDLKIDAYSEQEAMSHKVETLLQDTTPGAPASLETRLLDFLDGPEQVLLLQAPAGAGKTFASRYLAGKAWQEKRWVPVFIDLSKVERESGRGSGEAKPTKETLVEQALAARGLDEATAAQAKAERTFLLVVEGFDTCRVQSNLYVGGKMGAWAGKAVFTVRSAYLSDAPHAAYYFMPEGAHRRPKPQGLQIVGFTTSQAKYDEETFEVGPVVTVPEIVLQVAKANDAAQKPKRARERWQKAISLVSSRRHLRSHVMSYAQEARGRFEQGYSLLQRDILKPLFLQFLASIPKIAPPAKTSSSLPGFLSPHQNTSSPVLRKILSQRGPLPTTTPARKPRAFISYAWPIAKPDLTWVQGRLLQIVEDMAVAGIEVLLDILRLSVGIDINEFMRGGIDTSDSIFWIGTPRLKERIDFNRKPHNPATIECVHIQEKTKTHPRSLQSLWFLGSTLENAYPPAEGLNPQKNLHDFRDGREYFRRLPLLAATVLDIAHLPAFAKEYRAYCAQTKALEATITSSAVWERLEMAQEEIRMEQARVDARLQELMATIPEQYREYLEGTKEVQERALHTTLLRVREESTAPTTVHAQALAFYIPLKGGTQPDTPPELYFDFANRVNEFLASGNNESNVRLLLIQGGAGSGKSLFGRYLERELWRGWKVDSGAIPLFIALPQTRDPYHNLIQTTLQGLNFSDDDIALLKERSFVFILDGLDELPLEHVPAHGLLVANQLFDWPKAKVIITCRSQYLPALEKQVGTPYNQHLMQGQASMEEYYLMPFDDAQVTTYLQGYAATPEAEWPDWKLYQNHINTISGLKSLAATPFILKLLVSALPRLAMMHRESKNNTEKQRQTKWQHDGELKWHRERQKMVLKELAKRQRDEDGERGQEQQAEHGQVEQEQGEKQQTKKDEAEEEADKEEVEKEEAEQEVPQFLLNLSLPDLERYAEKVKTDIQELVAEPEQKTVYRVDVYQAFIEQLFEQEMWKEVTQQEVPLREDRVARYYELAGKLGQVLFTSGTSQMTLADVPPIDNGTNLLRGLPLQRVGDRVAFIHKSVQEYFTAWEWLKALDSMNETTVCKLMNSRSATAEVGVLEFVCQRFRAEPHKKLLLQQVLASREDEGQATAAANAITLLNFSRCSFSSMDLSSVRIPGANLNNALMDSTNLSHADMTGVSLRQAWMYEANLCGASLENTQLGMLPWLECGRVQCMAFSAPRERLVLGTPTELRVWDLRESTTLHQSPGDVTCVAVLGDRIATGARDGKVQMWDLLTGEPVGMPLLGHAGQVNTIVICEGKIVSTGESGMLVWDLATLQQVGEPLKDFGRVRCVAVQEGKLITGIDIDNVGTVHVWDLKTMQQVGVPLRGHKYGVGAVACFEGKIVSGSFDETVRLWDMSTMQQIGEPLKVKSGVTSLTVSEGKIIAGCIDGSLWMWDQSTFQQLGEAIRGHAGRVISLAGFKNKIISGSWDGTVRIMETVPSQQVGKPLEGHKGVVAQVAIFDGKIFSKGNETIRVWDTLTDQEEILHSTSGYSKIDTTGGKLTFATSRFLQVWDISTQKEIAMHSASSWPTSSVECMAVSQDKVVTGDYEGTILVVDLVTGELAGDFSGHSGLVNTVAIFEDMIISGGDDNAVCVWDLFNGELIREIMVGSKVRVVVVYEGKIVSGSEDGVIRLWHMSSGEQVGTPMTGHTAGVAAMATFAGAILSGSDDCTLRLWDPETSQCLRMLAFDADIRSIASHGEDCAVACGSSVQHWRYDGEERDLHLVGCRPDRWPLCMAGCRVEGSRGLSSDQAKTVAQLRASGTPITK